MSLDPRGRAFDSADLRPYWNFTGPRRLEKSLNELQGILRGIAADRVVIESEARRIVEWLDEHREFANRHPFNELIPQLAEFLNDALDDPSRVDDLLWLCGRLQPSGALFGAVTSDLQQLQGMLAGVAADSTITVDELRSIRAWADEREHLRGCWPFDEIYSLIVGVLQDGQVDAREHQMLLTVFREFAQFGEHKAVDLPLNEMLGAISGFCAVCPNVEFPRRRFCFTGASKRATRRKLAELVERGGGEFIPTVRQDLDYLIIGADGNPAWAFACYGRKVEQAMTYRRAGALITLVHEFDFWDAAADLGLES